MAKKTCSKGHVYDSSIYGDHCPFCPSQGSGTAVNSNTVSGNTGGRPTGRTEVNQDAGNTQPTGPTIPAGDDLSGGSSGGGTVIRPVNNGTGTPSGRKLVGLLLTYDINPNGQVFHIYEGRNYVGREATAHICVQGDPQISGKHFSILYRSIDRKFKFRDEQSSNGTFVNEVLADEGELRTHDIIRIGNTRLIFIAIPQIQQTDDTERNPQL